MPLVDERCMYPKWGFKGTYKPVFDELFYCIKEFKLLCLQKSILGILGGNAKKIIGVGD